MQCMLLQAWSLDIVILPDTHYSLSRGLRPPELSALYLRFQQLDVARARQESRSTHHVAGSHGPAPVRPL